MALPLSLVPIRLSYPGWCSDRPETLKLSTIVGRAGSAFREQHVSVEDLHDIPRLGSQVGEVQQPLVGSSLEIGPTG